MTQPQDVPWSRSRGRAVGTVPAPLGGCADFSVSASSWGVILDGLASLAPSARGSFQGPLRWCSQPAFVPHLLGEPRAGPGIGETLLSKNSWR